MALTVNAALKISVNNAAKTRFDAGTGNAYFRVFDAGDNPLGDIPMDDPSCSVDGGTGQLTFSPDTAENATATGTASYADFFDGDDVALFRLTCQAGTSAVANAMVLSSLSIQSGYPIELISATIG